MESKISQRSLWSVARAYLVEHPKHKGGKTRMDIAQTDASVAENHKESAKVKEVAAINPRPVWHTFFLQSILPAGI
jgi:lysozyme family protein